MYKTLGDHKAKNIMTKDILSVEKDLSIQEAVQIMDQHNIGALVVVSPIKDPLGIFTERDLLRRVVAKGLDPKKTKIETVMTPGLVCAQANDDAVTLLEAMFDNNFRHLPVLDGRKLVGIISLKDFYSVFLAKNSSSGAI